MKYFFNLVGRSEIRSSLRLLSGSGLCWNCIGKHGVREKWQELIRCRH